MIFQVWRPYTYTSELIAPLYHSLQYCCCGRRHYAVVAFRSPLRSIIVACIKQGGGGIPIFPCVRFFVEEGTEH